MAFMQLHPQLLYASFVIEVTGAYTGRHGLEDVVAQEFRGRELAFELRHVIEVFVLERGQDIAQRLQRQADINDHAELIDTLGVKRQIHSKGRPMYPLRRTEHLGWKGMGNHNVVTNFYGKHKEAFFQGYW